MKALGVARELFDTSQLIARLRSELASQQSLPSELENAHREEGVLEQRYTELRRRAACGRLDASRGVVAVSELPELSMSDDLVHRDSKLHQDQSMNEAIKIPVEGQRADGGQLLSVMKHGIGFCAALFFSPPCQRQRRLRGR